MSGKILGLESSPEILSTDQTAGSLKAQCLKNEQRYEVDYFVSESQINWAWYDTVRHVQNNSKLYIRNIIKRQIMVCSLYIEPP